jgi:hypothetical protein
MAFLSNTTYDWCKVARVVGYTLPCAWTYILLPLDELYIFLRPSGPLSKTERDPRARSSSTEKYFSHGISNLDD